MLLPQIDLDFADGSYTFALKLPQIVELEEKCGFTDQQGNRRKRGVVAIYGDVLAGLVVIDGQVMALPSEGRASAADCREIIRLGLIGGAGGLVNDAPAQMSAATALSLCERYVDTRPVVERWTLAAAILRAAVEGYEPPKKDEPAAGPARSTRKSRSKSETSSSTAG